VKRVSTLLAASRFMCEKGARKVGDRSVDVLSEISRSRLSFIVGDARLKVPLYPIEHTIKRDGQLAGQLAREPQQI
jgi:hypothetical protein